MHQVCLHMCFTKLHDNCLSIAIRKRLLYLYGIYFPVNSVHKG